MIVSKLNIDIEAEIVRHQAWRSRHRSPGPHLSQIIHYLLVQYDSARYGKEFEALQGHAGFMWEDVFSIVLARQLGSKQMEVEHEGIFITLDGFNTKMWRPREFKCTKISAANPVRSARFRHWHWQAMAQCIATDATEIEIVRIHLNGSYELGGGRFGRTVAVPEVIAFTRRELIQNWEMITRTKRTMDKTGFVWEGGR